MEAFIKALRQPLWSLLPQSSERVLIAAPAPVSLGDMNRDFRMNQDPASRGKPERVPGFVVTVFEN